MCDFSWFESSFTWSGMSQWRVAGLGELCRLIYCAVSRYETASPLLYRVSTSIHKSQGRKLFWLISTQHFHDSWLHSCDVSTNVCNFIVCNHKISTGFIQNNRRYNRLNTTKWISISTTLLSADWLKYEREIIWILISPLTRQRWYLLTYSMYRPVLALPHHVLKFWTTFAFFSEIGVTVALKTLDLMNKLKPKDKNIRVCVLIKYFIL